MQKKIIMTEMAHGADCEADGRSHGVKLYEKGKEYMVGPRLAQDFLNLKVAELAGAEPVAQKRAKKDLARAPETK